MVKFKIKDIAGTRFYCKTYGRIFGQRYSDHLNPIYYNPMNLETNINYNKL